MSYKTTVVVGRFTAEDAEEQLAETGRNFNPVVTTREEARKQAMADAAEECSDNERVVSARLKEEAPGGWIFTVTID